MHIWDKTLWIIEGMAIRFFEYRIQKADIVIFIDTPQRVCFYRVFKRALQWLGREYFSSAHGCPERGPNLKLLRFIWNFPNKQKKQALALIDQYKNKKQIFVLKTQHDIQQLLSNLNKQ